MAAEHRVRSEASRNPGNSASLRRGIRIMADGGFELYPYFGIE